MALGYCPSCDKLVTITPCEFKYAGSRERAWRPIEHLSPEGKRCDNRKAI